jgi:hypothetical protein
MMVAGWAGGWAAGAWKARRGRGWNVGAECWPPCACTAPCLVGALRNGAGKRLGSDGGCGETLASAYRTSLAERTEASSRRAVWVVRLRVARPRRVRDSDDGPRNIAVPTLTLSADPASLPAPPWASSLAHAPTGNALSVWAHGSQQHTMPRTATPGPHGLRASCIVRRPPSRARLCPHAHVPAISQLCDVRHRLAWRTRSICERCERLMVSTSHSTLSLSPWPVYADTPSALNARPCAAQISVCLQESSLVLGVCVARGTGPLRTPAGRRAVPQARCVSAGGLVAIVLPTCVGLAPRAAHPPPSAVPRQPTRAARTFRPRPYLRVRALHAKGSAHLGRIGRALQILRQREQHAVSRVQLTCAVSRVQLTGVPLRSTHNSCCCCCCCCCSQLQPQESWAPCPCRACHPPAAPADCALPTCLFAMTSSGAPASSRASSTRSSAAWLSSKRLRAAASTTYTTACERRSQKQCQMSSGGPAGQP